MNSISESFPKTREDISGLHKTAVDAAADLSSTTVAHARKVQDHIHDLADHAQEESRQNLRDVGTKLNELGDGLRQYVGDHPLAVVATGLFIGFVLGRRSVGRVL